MRNDRATKKEKEEQKKEEQKKEEQQVMQLKHYDQHSKVQVKK